MTKDFEKTRDAARGKWRGILVHFGVDESYLKNEHGPCPLCRDGKDRFRFDDLEGDGTYYCSQCGPGSGMKLVMTLKNWPFDRAAKEIDSILGVVQVTQQRAQRTEDDKRRILIKLWKEALPVQPGDPVWLYLERRCGDPSAVLEDLRYHPSLRHPMGDTHPAMLALLRPNEGKAVGIHRTFLTPTGMKAGVDPVRMVLGECAQVRLGGAQERLGVAEGIETAISVSKLLGCPVWSALNANGLKSWNPPEGVKRVVICGDNDENLTGQEAAYVLGHRLSREGFEVEMQIPLETGTDWNDVFLSNLKAGAA